MKALIIGATGATGVDLVNQVLADDYFTEVIIFVRKATQYQHPKLKEYVVDFDEPDDWAHLVKGDIAFSAMGTTLKLAGSKQAQWRVDYDYQYHFAVVASKNQVPTFVLVSAQNASKNSMFFYSKMKGALEDAIRKLPFSRLLLFNPPLLDRNSSDRPGEQTAFKVINFFNKLGMLKSQTALKTSDLAAAMIRAVKQNNVGVEQFVGQKIHQA